jgi:hypothetical protein
VANDGNKVAVASRLYAQHAKAVLSIVERHPLDGAGDYLAVWLDHGGRSNIGLMIGDAGAYGERRKRSQAQRRNRLRP